MEIGTSCMLCERRSAVTVISTSPSELVSVAVVLASAARAVLAAAHEAPARMAATAYVIFGFMLDPFRT